MAISTLKTQDGVHFLTAELNGDVIADRDLEAAWQEWDVLPDPFGDGNVVVLKSAHGKYLSAYSPEYCAQLSLLPGTVKATAEHPDVWERWRAVRDGQVVRLQSAQWGLWLSPQNVPPNPLAGGGAVYCNGPDPAAWEAFTPSNMAAFPGASSGSGGGAITSGPDALVGLVSIHGRSFGDETGPRIVHGVFRLRRAQEVPRGPRSDAGQLDRVAQCRPAVRARVVAAQRRVLDRQRRDQRSDPRSLVGRRACAAISQACRDRGLRVNLTSGDFYNWSDQQAEDSFRRCAQIAASVSPMVVWLGAAANELRGVHPARRRRYAVAQCEALQDIWARDYPGGLRSISDPGDQAKGGMQRLSGGNSTVALIHDVRWEVERRPAPLLQHRL